MIADELATALEEAVSQNPLARDLDLKFNVQMMAPPLQDGRKAIMVELIISARSPLLGQRLWEATVLPVDPFLDPLQLRTMVNDLGLHMDAIRGAAASMVVTP
jgi:hypothetical protein